MYLNPFVAPLQAIRVKKMARPDSERDVDNGSEVSSFSSGGSGGPCSSGRGQRPAAASEIPKDEFTRYGCVFWPYLLTYVPGLTTALIVMFLKVGYRRCASLNDYDYCLLHIDRNQRLIL